MAEAPTQPLYSTVMMTPVEYYHTLTTGQTGGPGLPMPSASGFTAILHMIQDLAMKKLQTDDLEIIKNMIPEMLSTELSVAEDFRKAGPKGDMTSLYEAIQVQYRSLFDNWKAGIWKGMGTAYSSAMEQFLGSNQLLYNYKTLLYQIALTPRMRRYWNSLYTPTVLNASSAWIAYRRGYITYKDFEEYASYDGWDSKGIDTLEKIFSKEPTAWDAFNWWTKGLIKEEKRNSLYFGDGWDSEHHKNLTEAFYAGFRVYDLARLADFIELDQTWTIKKLKAAGMRDEDIARTWKMLELRPLREEVRSLTTKWTWRYRMGRTTLDQIGDAFDRMGVKPKEKELLLEKAQLDYEDELINEWIEILRWRFRTAVITEEQFLDGLIELGIKEEKANLIVETEKAMGYYGYY